MRRVGVAWILTLGALLLVAADRQEASRIRVGPNILVSRDGDAAHCETMVAANPTNSKNLLGTSTTLTLPDGGATNKVYASLDGGATWTDAGFPEQREAPGSGDPQVGFGITGTAYFAGIHLGKGIEFFRSEDGGRTWGKPVNLGKGDHEQLTTDDTLGPFAGRVYIADERHEKGSKELEDLVMRRRVVLFRSTDDGRSFVGPIEVAKGDGKGLAVYSLLVLSDGTLFIPMSQYPNYSIDKEASTWKLLSSLSSDGGVTFSPRRPIAEVRFGGSKALRDRQKSPRVDEIGLPVFAVGRGGKFRDRLYAGYTNLEGERYRLFLTHSSDRGATWSKPKPVETTLPADASEFQPMIAVNPEGVLGVFFYSTEGYPERDRFDVYFTASLDGGETFLPKARVSSETSHPFGPGNLRPGPFVQKERGMITANFVSGVSRWKSGGDYIGMTADADGTFHPFWADGRSGTYQLYSAAVRVPTDAAAKKPAPTLEKVSLTDQVTLVFDPIQYDQGKREVLLPVRIKNESKETLYPPFTVEIKELVHPYFVKANEPSSVPTILNSSNKKTGVGATFDYSKSLHDLEALEPDAVSDAIIWRFQAESPIKTDFYVGAEVSGFAVKKEEKK